MLDHKWKWINVFLRKHLFENFRSIPALPPAVEFCFLNLISADSLLLQLQSLPWFWPCVSGIGLDNKCPQEMCREGKFKCLDIPEPWPQPPRVGTTIAQHHSHLTTPSLLPGPSWSAPGTAHSLPSCLSHCLGLPCQGQGQGLLLPGSLSRERKGSDPEMHLIIKVINQYENKS